MISKIILQSLIGGLFGASIMATVLLSDGFNPFHNERFIYFGFGIGSLSSLAGAVSIRNKPYQPLTKQLHKYIGSLPAGHPNWHSGLKILTDLENQELAQTKTPFRSKLRS